MNPVILTHNPHTGRMALAIFFGEESDVQPIKRLTEAHKALRSHPMELMFLKNEQNIVPPNVRYPA